MNTQGSQLELSRPSRIQRLASWLVASLTSRHGKRILFITSLYCQVVRIDQMRGDAIKKLNNIMLLARSETALNFPIAVRGLVWKGADLSTILTAQDLYGPISYDRAETIASTVVDRMPQCLRYDTDCAMRKDVRHLLQNGPNLAAA